MKHQFFLLTFIFFLTSKAQDNDSIVIKSGKWQLGPSFSADYTFRQLYTADPGLEWLVHDRNNWESPKFGFTTGLNALYYFNSNLALGFGLQYSTKGYKMELDDIYVIQDVDEDPVLGNVQTWYRMDYVDLPVCVSFFVGQQKVRFVGSAGVAANFFLNKRDRSVVSFEDGTEQVYVSQLMDGNKKVSIAPMISAGISYTVNEFTTLRLEPVFRYGVTKIEDAPITTILFSAGLNLSYYMSF